MMHGPINVKNVGSFLDGTKKHEKPSCAQCTERYLKWVPLTDKSEPVTLWTSVLGHTLFQITPKALRAMSELILPFFVYSRNSTKGSRHIAHIILAANLKGAIALCIIKYILY